MTVSQETITALILAGGRATRMGGQDKGLLEWRGQPFAALLAEQLAGQVDGIRINANRNLDAYRGMGYPVISDTLADYQGPLAGMLSGLRAMDEDWLLTVPCDGPILAPDYAQRMHAAVRESGHRLAVATDGNRLQPVYALIHRSLEESLAEYLAGPDRKIDRWFARNPYSTVSFADRADMFANVNTPADLVALENSTA
jgi:molybdopterin-guanine dinucleotide biosynthesis protein A